MSDIDASRKTGARASARIGRRAALLVAISVGLLIPATPAWAHAQLQTTTPAAGSRLTSAPSSVTLQFSEGVNVTPQGVKVFDARGKRMDLGAARHPAVGATFVVLAPLRPQLPDGTYAVVWRAVSDDAHPVQGAFTFGVGSGALTRVSAPGSAGGGTNLPVSVTFAVIRWSVFCGLALLIGGAAFLLLCWPRGRVDARAKSLLWGGWAAVSGASFLALALQGPYTDGGGLLDAMTASSFGATLTTRFGAVLSLRLVLLGLSAMWLTWQLPRWLPDAPPAPPAPPPKAPAVITGAALALGLLATWPPTGHAGAGSQVALAAPVDVAHLAAMSLWLGGLAMLALTLLPTRRAAHLARALPVFSRLAFCSVVVLIVTGAYQSWRQVGTLPAFTGTTYGRLLLLKLVVFVALIALANLGRRFVQRHYGPARFAAVEAGPEVPAGAVTAGELALVGARRPADRGPPVSRSMPLPLGDDQGLGPVDPRASGRLRRSLLVEVFLGVVVLALTSVLVASAPARNTYHPTARATLTFPAATVRVVVSPARAGQNLIDLQVVDKAGRPLTVAQVRAAVSLPSRRLSQLPVRFERAGPGHWTAAAANVPFAGRWQLSVTVRAGDSSESTVTTTIRIR